LKQGRSCLHISLIIYFNPVSKRKAKGKTGNVAFGEKNSRHAIKDLYPCK